VVGPDGAIVGLDDGAVGPEDGATVGSGGPHVALIYRCFLTNAHGS